MKEPADELTDAIKQIAADIKMMDEVRRINLYIDGTMHRADRMVKDAVRWLAESRQKRSK